MKSYKDCGFSFILPKAVKFENKLVIRTRFQQNSGSTEKFVVYKAMLVDKVQNRCEALLENYVEKMITGQNIRIDMFYGNRNPLIRGSLLTIECLSDAGIKTLVKFVFIDSENAILEDVVSVSMSDVENTNFVKILERKKQEDETLKQKQTTKHSATTLPSNMSCVANELPGLDRYRDALAEEKRHLKSEGGRKYKITNGKQLGSTNGTYSYLFDLETELYISDDAPITLLIGMEHINGSVLMCEDFQIIVLIEKNIGERVSSAYISVEPWKLLEALEERLKAPIRLQGSMALKLLKDGPKLSTPEPIEKIAKGQENVIRRAMSEPVTIVWGPPGTGKTQTMAELAIKYIEKKYSVLIVSHSNVSVDGVAERIHKLLGENKKEKVFESGQVLRYGYIRNEELSKNRYISSFRYALKKSPILEQKMNVLQEEYNQLRHTNAVGTSRMLELHKEIGKIRNQVKEEEKKCVEDASVVITTISKVTIDKLFEDRTFDVVMFDEISMAYVLQVVCAATFAKQHLVCVGDFMQLAPIAQSNAKKILCEDLFTFLKINIDGELYYHPWLVMLDVQRRMHPAISAFSNKYVYRNLLKDIPGIEKEREPIVNTYPFYGKPISYIDLFGSYCAACKNQDNSRYNILNAAVAVCVALNAEMETDKISIIAPYAAQTRLIRAMLQDYKERNKTQVRCATVHQFQGSESDVILFDTVESYPGAKTGFLMGKDLNSIRRLINVALTRARGKFIAIGNTRFWENGFKGTEHTLYKLQQYILNKGNHVSHGERTLESLIESLNADKVIQFYAGTDKYVALYIQDIDKAKKKIVLSLPSAKLDVDLSMSLLKRLVEAKKRGVQVFIKTNQYEQLPKEWKEFSWGTDNAVFPVTMIDDKITWYGAPQAEYSFTATKDLAYKAVCHVQIRINGVCTAEMIKSLSGMEYRNTVNGLVQLTERDRTTVVSKENMDTGKGVTGLAAYIQESFKCPKCKKQLHMTKGKSGKMILWCKDCKAPQLLSPEEINHYICIKQVRCPICSAQLSAGLGKMGVYARCGNGHFVGLDTI